MTFTNVVLTLLREDWRSPTSKRTILHCVLDCCRSRNLEEVLHEKER